MSGAPRLPLAFGWEDSCMDSLTVWPGVVGWVDVDGKATPLLASCEEGGERSDEG